MKRIPLTQNKYALVDDEDFEEMSKYNWRFAQGYAIRHVRKDKEKRRTTTRMHRMILDVKKGRDIDHVDGNGLNNQKINLRIATESQNMMNRKLNKNNKSGYKGVHWHIMGKWLAQIRCFGKGTYLGVFDNKLEAAKVYNEKAKELFGKFARLNSIK